MFVTKSVIPLYAHPDSQKLYFVAFNAWKRCRKRVDGLEEHYAFFVIRNSKLAGPSRSAPKWINWHRRITRTVSPKRNLRDIKDSVILHWINRAKMRRCDFDQTSELQSQSRTVSIENQAKNVQNPFLFNKFKDGTLLPQVIPGGTGTRPKACGAHEFNSLF